jgi:probable phosphoglycerate mutase
MLAARLQPWLESLKADGFVVSHGGVARALITLIAGVSPQAAENADIWQGRAILFAGGGLRWIG